MPMPPAPPTSDPDVWEGTPVPFSLEPADRQGTPGPEGPELEPTDPDELAIHRRTPEWMRRARHTSAPIRLHPVGQDPAALDPGVLPRPDIRPGHKARPDAVVSLAAVAALFDAREERALVQLLDTPRLVLAPLDLGQSRQWLYRRLWQDARAQELCWTPLLAASFRRHSWLSMSEIHQAVAEDHAVPALLPSEIGTLLRPWLQRPERATDPVVDALVATAPMWAALVARWCPFAPGQSVDRVGRILGANPDVAPLLVEGAGRGVDTTAVAAWCARALQAQLEAVTRVAEADRVAGRAHTHSPMRKAGGGADVRPDMLPGLAGVLSRVGAPSGELDALGRALARWWQVRHAALQDAAQDADPAGGPRWNGERAPLPDALDRLPLLVGTPVRPGTRARLLAQSRHWPRAAGLLAASPEVSARARRTLFARWTVAERLSAATALADYGRDALADPELVDLLSVPGEARVPHALALALLGMAPLDRVRAVWDRVIRPLPPAGVGQLLHAVEQLGHVRPERVAAIGRAGLGQLLGTAAREDRLRVLALLARLGPPPEAGADVPRPAAPDRDGPPVPEAAIPGQTAGPAPGRRGRLP